MLDRRVEDLFGVGQTLDDVVVDEELSGGPDLNETGSGRCR